METNGIGEENEQLLIVFDEFLQTSKEEAQSNLRILEKIKASYRAIQQIREQMQEQVKRDIEALTSHFEADTGDTNAEIGQVAKEEQQLLQNLREVERHNQELSTQWKESQESLEKLKGEKEYLQGEKDRLDNETTVVLPKRREEISLYQNISRIRFDFDGPPNDVKGYIVNKSDVKPFLFDRSKNSQFFITNALWDCMKEES